MGGGSDQSRAPWWVANPWALIAVVVLAGGVPTIGSRFVPVLNPATNTATVATAAQNTATAAAGTQSVVAMIYEEVKQLRQQVTEQTDTVKGMDKKLGDLKSYVDIVERELRARDTELNEGLRSEILQMFDELRTEINKVPAP